jgi:hypothetical protein
MERKRRGRRVSHLISATLLAEQQIGGVYAGGSSLDGVEVGFDVVGAEDDEVVDEVETAAP